LRRRVFNKLSSYRAMYREITRRIASGEPGDDLNSVLVSTSTVLELEAALQEECPRAFRSGQPPAAPAAAGAGLPPIDSIPTPASHASD
jgi:hypothetical protein